jgi:MFS family permease
VASRILQGFGGAMMVPVGRLTLVRTFPKSELVRAMSFVAIPGLIGPMLGPVAGGFIVGYFNWRLIFFINLPIGLLGLYLVYRNLPNYRQTVTPPLDFIGLGLFGGGIGLLAYVLEVFGEHGLSSFVIGELLAISAICLAAYGWRATRIQFPLLQLGLFRIRTFRASVAGSFFTRLGIGGIPFLFPLLYQVGLGFTPIESGLLIMPQAMAAVSLKMVMRRILKRFGYRRVLIFNTVMLGVMLLCFATIGAGTPVWLIVTQVFIFGVFTSLQYTCMNTLVYADVTEGQTSGASSITSTVQQMAISFGIATASLLAAVFVPDRFHTGAPEMVAGIHKALLILGGWTIFSSIIFSELRKEDGDTLSLHKALQHPGT